MGSITMLFAAFTSAYIVRSAGQDWVPLEAPSILWFNTVVLLLSSVTMEVSRRSFHRWQPITFRKWLLITAVLGAAFLAGQVFAWRELSQQGIYLASHPHSSFFYVLALAVRYRLTPGESSSPSIAASYWHFVDGLWLYLLVVLFYL